jgi:uncharacterized glyoxalase superfamily protein PhnB
LQEEEMAKTQSVNPSVIPAIKYQDAPRAIDWLQKAFGFERHFVVEGEGGRIDHAQLARPGGMVMLGSKGKPDPKNPWSDARGGVYVVVVDVDADFARAKAAGAEIVMPLRDTDYGARVLGARSRRQPLELRHLRPMEGGEVTQPT